MNEIRYQTDCEDIDWHVLKAALREDSFDNGRSPHQYEASFNNSYAVVFAFDNDKLIGTARALSDGVCNAYVVDVWVQTPYRKRGIASTMMDKLLAQLAGQHVYLFTDDAVPFYEKNGFQVQDVGLGRVVGKWLNPNLTS